MTAYLIVRATVPEADRDDFDTWYRDEHLPDAHRVFGSLSAQRGWVEEVPDLHVAIYEFPDLDAAQATVEAPGIRDLIAEFDRVWQGRVTRTREVTKIAQRLPETGTGAAEPQTPGEHPPKSFWSRLLPGNTPWAKARRAISALLLFLTVALAAEAVVLQHNGWTLIDELWVAWLLVAFSVGYFFTVVVGVIFLTSTEFRPNPIWLARDATVSILYCVLSFAILYRFTGISLSACGTPGEADLPNAADALYFSAVTFSTLGYGDYRPCEGGRLIAAAHAVYGNLHLGLIVGSAFFFAQIMGETQDRSEDPQ